MNRTRLVATTDEIVAGLATGYLARAEIAGGFVRAQHAYPMGGEGGLVSSIEDLALWERNFTTGAVGGRALIAALEAPAPFANGTANAYARGLEIHPWRGCDGGPWRAVARLQDAVPAVPESASRSSALPI